MKRLSFSQAADQSISDSESSSFSTTKQHLFLFCTCTRPHLPWPQVQVRHACDCPSRESALSLTPYIFTVHTTLVVSQPISTRSFIPFVRFFSVSAVLFLYLLLLCVSVCFFFFFLSKWSLSLASFRTCVSAILGLVLHLGPHHSRYTQKELCRTIKCFIFPWTKTDYYTACFCTHISALYFKWLAST